MNIVLSGLCNCEVSPQVRRDNVFSVDAKVQTILEFPAPRLRPQLRLLLGLDGCYCEFIINFVDVTAPLTSLAIPEESSVCLIKYIFLLVTLFNFWKLIKLFSSYTVFFLSCWPLWNWKVWGANNVTSSLFLDWILPLSVKSSSDLRMSLNAALFYNVLCIMSCFP